jgi:hypothetical protein
LEEWKLKIGEVETLPFSFPASKLPAALSFLLKPYTLCLKPCAVNHVPCAFALWPVSITLNPEL